MIMKDETCLCAGYVGRGDTHGDQGICCCGLYWQGEMPMHTKDGEVVPEKIAERWYRHTRETHETHVRRTTAKREKRLSRPAWCV